MALIQDDQKGGITAFHMRLTLSNTIYLSLRSEGTTLGSYVQS